MTESVDSHEVVFDTYLTEFVVCKEGVSRPPTLQVSVPWSSGRQTTPGRGSKRLSQKSDTGENHRSRDPSPSREYGQKIPVFRTRIPG